jgi:hypothetical protein
MSERNESWLIDGDRVKLPKVESEDVRGEEE